MEPLQAYVDADVRAAAPASGLPPTPSPASARCCAECLLCCCCCTARRLSPPFCLPNTKYPIPPPHTDPQASEEYFVCAWSLDPATGAPLLLLAGKRGVLLAVDAATGRLAACMEGHGSSINDMAVHPTRPHLVVTASRDQSLRLWNLRTR